MTKDDPAYIACHQSVDGEAMKIRIGRAGKTLPSSPGVLSDGSEYLDETLLNIVILAAEFYITMNALQRLLNKLEYSTLLY